MHDFKSYESSDGVTRYRKFARRSIRRSIQRVTAKPVHVK